MRVSLLYRGKLESCNFGCVYCPFAKKVDSRGELTNDRLDLQRFLAWARSRSTDRLSVFFTPWGEALVRRWYREALVELTSMEHIERAVIQTNLSAPLTFVERCDRSRLALWATWHPEWMPRATFVERIRSLVTRGVRVSAGVVGFPRFVDDIARLRDELPSEVYLWINAPKSYGAKDYDDDLVRAFTAVDPLYRVNAADHKSHGKSCKTGASVVSVDGDGNLTRCHFVKARLGNIYEGPIEQALTERPCPNDTCGCHIGYVHLDELRLDRVFGDGILERVPRSLPVLP